jgi:16S rRNA (uracil1498-N3)-methyltransferase
MANLEYFFMDSDGSLPKSEEHHLKVKRYSVGDHICLTNGEGKVDDVVITAVNPISYDVITSKTFPHPFTDKRPKIKLVLALLKGKAWDDAVKMAVELGVDEIVPWQANRSIAKWNKPERDLADLEALVLEASKQCRRAWFPEVHGLVKSRDFADLPSLTSETAIVLYEHATLPLIQVLGPEVLGPEHGLWPSQDAEAGLRSPQDDGGRLRSRHDDGGAGEITLVIGPEGGITDVEIAKLGSHGAKMASLGDLILRAPTAVASTLVTVQNYLADNDA